MRSRGSLSTVAVLDPARAPTVHARPRKSVVVARVDRDRALLAAYYVVERVRRETREPSVRGG